MDISDGLARDLPRMLGKNGAELVVSEESLHPELLAFARDNALDPVALAYTGGEDYSLLGAVPAQDFAALAAALNAISPVTFLGTVAEQPGILCNGCKTLSKGFDHFDQTKRHTHHKKPLPQGSHEQP